MKNLIKKNQNPISFFIPAYDCASTISSSISSILETNFSNGDELIIVDDKSKDNTLSLIKEISRIYRSKGIDIKIIEHDQNKGGAVARNTAIKNSSHNLLFCLDSDNILERNSIEILKKYLLENNLDAASFREIRFFTIDPSKISHTWRYKNGSISFADFLSGYINPASSGNYLFTKESWKKAGGYPEGRGALDAWGFGLRQIAVGMRMGVMKDGYYFHRHGHDSYSHRYDREKKALLDSTEILYPFFDQLDPKDVIYLTKKDEKSQSQINWFKELEKRPLHLKNGQVGKNGRLIIPWNLKIIALIKKSFKILGMSSLLNPIKKRVKFIKDFLNFSSLSTKIGTTKPLWKNCLPQLHDNTSETLFDRHYVYHPAWAARIIKEVNPQFHVDISSTLHFCTILSAFIPVKFYDYRPAELHLSNLTSEKADLTNLFFDDNSIKSLSCMHTVEHIGLGRYGDPIDPEGDQKAIRELKRVTAIGGSLLFVVPIAGSPTIMFNAHRIYSYNQIIKYFDGFELKKFSLVPDKYEKLNFIENATKEDVDMQKYGCGCFWFIKK